MSGAFRAIRSSLVLLLAGCSLYSFKGGGLPREIRTAAVDPFDNLTAEPAIGQEINLAVREAVQKRLGLRSAAEGQADAIVKGIVRRYEPDLPVAYSGTPGQSGGGQQVQVSQRRVQMMVEIEILNRVTEKPILQKQTFTVDGEYGPGREAEGRQKALDKLITQIVQKARSQW